MTILRQGFGWQGAGPSKRAARSGMRRRDLIATMGGAVVVPAFAALGNQPGAPVIGVLDYLSPEEEAINLAGFQQGLNEAGYSEGRTVAIEYRWARGRADSLPPLVKDLIDRRVDVILACGGTIPVLAAKAATQTIPIVAVFGLDPIKLGAVGSLNQPGSNITGVWVYSSALVAKRLELLHALVPDSRTIAHLANPTAPGFAEETADAQAAAQKLGLRLLGLKATSVAEVDAAFASFPADRPGAILVSSFPFFAAVPIRDRVVALAQRDRLPTSFSSRDLAEAGGVMSYGPNLNDIYRQLGLYVGRILKGEWPADLPVQLPEKFDFVINVKAAKGIGLNVPPTLLALADDVIE